MRAILLAASLVVIAGAAAAADAPPVTPDSARPHAGTRTLKPALHDPGRRSRHCTMTDIRVREGNRWVKRTRRTCS